MFRLLNMQETYGSETSRGFKVFLEHFSCFQEVKFASEAYVSCAVEQKKIFSSGNEFFFSRYKLF